MRNSSLWEAETAPLLMPLIPARIVPPTILPRPIKRHGQSKHRTVALLGVQIAPSGAVKIAPRPATEMSRAALLCCTALALVLGTGAHAQELPFSKDDTESCNCVQTEWGTKQCTLAGCMRAPNPEVVAALRKRYPDLEDDGIFVLDEGKHNGKQHYIVRFYRSKAAAWIMACRLTLNPVRLSKCRPVHA
jgi:hypothetical protein